MGKKNGNRGLTRRNKNKKNGGGGTCGGDAMPMPKAMMGGKRRKTRKMAKGASDWNKKVMEVYHMLKKKNPATKLGDAMKHAAALKKKGEL
jgi:hypothetical protein